MPDALFVNIDVIVSISLHLVEEELLFISNATMYHGGLFEMKHLMMCHMARIMEKGSGG